MAELNNITVRQLGLSMSKVKEKLDGKANTQHGTHVSYAATTGALTPGEEGKSGSYASVSRGDHTHYLPPYPTELKCPNTLTLLLNDSEAFKFDGSQNISFNILPSDVGAAPIYHATNANTYGLSSESVYGHAKASSTTPAVAGTANVGTETSTFARGDHVHPVQTSVSGTAGSAYKLTNAASLKIGNSSKSFDGSIGITWTLDEIGAATKESVEQATTAEVDSMLDSILK